MPYFCVSGGWYNRLVDIESSLRALGSVSGSQLFQVAAPGSRDCSGRRQHANICFLLRGVCLLFTVLYYITQADVHVKIDMIFFKRLEKTFFSSVWLRDFLKIVLYQCAKAMFCSITVACNIYRPLIVVPALYMPAVRQITPSKIFNSTNALSDSHHDLKLL